MIDGRPRRAAPKRRVIAQARVPVGELEHWFAQLRNDAQNNVLDHEVIHQRITRFLAEYQRHETNSRNSPEQRLAQFREEISQSLEGQDKNLKEWTRGKLTHVTSQMKGLQSFAAELETFVRQKCSSHESGAAASEPSYTQGRERASVSTRVNQGAIILLSHQARLLELLPTHRQNHLL